MNIPSRSPARALVLVAGLLGAPVALAQNSETALSGRVADTDTVTVRNVGTGLVREVPVKKGKFSARNLPVGTYEVTVRHADGTEQKVLVKARIGITTRVL